MPFENEELMGAHAGGWPTNQILWLPPPKGVELGRLQVVIAVDDSPPKPRVIRFGDVELDLACGEVRKAGHRIRLAPQPFKILALLASRADQLVTREEIQRQVWGSETYVDYEKGLNFCIKQIRAALGDDAETPRYIETLPRRGYRFIAAVEQATHESTHSSAPATSNSPLDSGPSAPSPAVAEGGDVEARRGRARWRWALAAGSAAALVAITAGIVLKLTRQPALGFQQRDWVLISNFQNRTRESVFDGTLEYALERELSNSKFVNVVPRERINDALLLMKKPLDSPLSAALGREVCLRDGGIRALLTGRVEKLDTTYLLGVELVNPSSGVTVASLSEEARGQREVPAALRRLSNRVRERLGEELPLIARSRQALEKATTPSLHALQYFSQGMVLVNEEKWREAAAMLDQAVQEDPQFASAHIYLAHCYSNLDREDLAGPHYQKAFELADTTTDRERYFILGSYYGRYKQDPDKEVNSYEILVRLYPDHYWGVTNIVGAYRRLGMPNKAIIYVIRRALMRPNDPMANYSAATSLLTESDNPAGARTYALRARMLLTPEVLERDPHITSWILLFPASDYWQQGQPQEAGKDLGQMVQFASSLNVKTRDTCLEEVSLSYITLGRLRTAEDLLKSLRDPDERNFSLALLALAREDPASLRKYSGRLGEGGEMLNTSLPPIFMARAGLLTEAQHGIAVREHLAGWGEDTFTQAFVKVMKGELALARGETTRAIALLQGGLQPINRSGTFTYFLGAETLARAWERKGNPGKAVGVLEKASAERLRGTIVNGFAWMRVQQRLAQLYHKVGRDQDAERIETELRNLLADADPDFPMLVQLGRQQQAASLPTE